LKLSYTSQTVNVRELIEKSVRARRRGEPFTPGEFKKIGRPALVRRELQRLARDGKIKAVAHNVYYKPHERELFGGMPPVPKIVNALTIKQGHVVQITGAEAANRLGLSSQVPVKSIYLTNGPSRRIVVGKLEVVLRHKPNKELPAAGLVAGDVIQALRYLGPREVEPSHIEKLSRTLQPETKARLKKLSRHLPGWLRKIIEQF
jgi:hypothetical protein